jgi:hypothetical protein
VAASKILSGSAPPFGHDFYCFIFFPEKGGGRQQIERTERVVMGLIPGQQSLVSPTPTLQAIFFFLFLVLPSSKKGGRGGVGARAAAAAKINSCRSYNSSAPGKKRNKYRNDPK